MAVRKILEYGSSPEHYLAEVCSIECFDARFRGAYDALRKAGGYADMIVRAGGAQILGSTDSEPADLIANIGTSIRLHDSKEIWLTVHEDCGAYGGRIPKARLNAFDFLGAELRRASDRLKSSLDGELNGRKVRLFVLMFDGVYEVF